MPSLAQLHRDLDALRQTLPESDSCRDQAFDFEFFLQKVDRLVESADPADRRHIRERAKCMLGSAGLIPSDNEGDPCS